MLGFDGGAIGADIYCDRSGIHCRRIEDCSKVLDALKDPEEGYYDPRDPFTTVPRSAVLPAYQVPRAGFRGGRGAGRRAVRRYPGVHGLPGRLADRKAHRGRRRPGDKGRCCGTTWGLPCWSRATATSPADAEIEPMKVDFRRAIAALLPVFMPDILYRLGPGRSAGVQGSSPRLSYPPSSRPASSSVPARCNRWTTSWNWPTG